jgi:hypothetical protein
LRSGQRRSSSRRWRGAPEGFAQRKSAQIGYVLLGIDLPDAVQKLPAEAPASTELQHYHVVLWDYDFKILVRNIIGLEAHA